MKKSNHLTVWGAVAAISVSMLSVPVLAAQEDNAASTRTGRGESSKSDKTFTHIDRANKLIGKTVIGSDNQKIGKIENFVVDLTSGRILYTIVGVGGVLGAGERHVAVAPNVFTETEGNTVHVNVDKQKFNDAPQFTKELDKDMELGKADFVSKVYQYYGQNAWWQGAKPAGEGSFNNVHKASDLIGMKVKSSSDEALGKLDNVVLDVPAGRVVYAILSADSSLNVGNDFFALPPDAFTLSSDHKSLTSGITKDKLAGAPHFTKDNWQQLSDPAFASQVYQYYGKQAYFQKGTGLEPTGREDKKDNK
jgi:sporulation protein YlmC with PRC-barrel domain